MLTTVLQATGVQSNTNKLGVTSGGTTYSLFSAGPSIPVGVGVDVYGKLEGVSPCFGTNVNVTSWRKNRMHC